MTDFDPRQQAAPDGCGDAAPTATTATLLEALRGQPAPYRVVAAGSEATPGDVGAVEIIDGNSNLTTGDPGNPLTLAQVYALTHIGMAADINNPGHDIGNVATEEWVVEQAGGYLGQWPDGAELRYVDGSYTSVADNPTLLQQLHSEDPGNSYRYAAIEVAYQGFPRAVAIADLANAFVGGQIHYYEIETVKLSTGHTAVTGRLARQYTQNAAGQDVVVEHWLLGKDYAFPTPAVVARFKQADAQWASLHEFFDSAGVALERGLYAQTELVLVDLP